MNQPDNKQLVFFNTDRFWSALINMSSIFQFFKSIYKITCWVKLRTNTFIIGTLIFCTGLIAKYREFQVTVQL